MKKHKNATPAVRRHMMRLIVCITAIVAGGALNGCGKKEPPPAQGQAAADSVNATTALDTVAVPRVLQDSTLVHLAYRLHPGELFRYKAVLRESASGTFDNQPGSQKEESDWYFNLKVSHMNKDSSVVVLLQYDSITYTMTSDHNSVDFNSNDSTTWHDPRYTNWTGLLGLQFPVTVSANGEITKVEGVETVADRIFESRQEDKSALPPDAPQQVVDQITEGEIKAIVGHVFMPLPEHAIAKDSSWMRKFTGMVEPFPTRNIITYTMEGYATNGGCRTGTVKSVLDVVITQRQLSDSTAVLSLHSGSITGDGSSEIDLDRGIVRKKKSRITIAMDYSSLGLGKFAGGKGHLVKNFVTDVVLQML